METTSDNEEIECNSRSRSPSFTTEETMTLLMLIEQYKNVVYNRSCNINANRAKAVVWKKITHEFNKVYKSDRSVDCCRTKWENIKRNVRKVSKGVFENKSDGDSNEVVAKALEMLAEADTNTFEIPPDFISNLREYNAEYNDEKDMKRKKLEEECAISNRKKRDSNFMPSECSLLLQCARLEKKYLFCKKTTSRSIALKNSAWERVTRNFNKRNPRQRSMKSLQNKFHNIKQSLRKSEDSKLDSQICLTPIKENCVKIKEQIKEEPYEKDLSDFDDDMVDNESLDDKSNGYTLSDPLSTVLNGNDDDMFYNNNSMQPENSEISKLKMDLLKFKMETAKLDRQRVEEALAAERSERESRALETALRLRAARLELVAAESKIPQNHPMFGYTNQEIAARDLMFNNIIS